MITHLLPVGYQILVGQVMNSSREYRAHPEYALIQNGTSKTEFNEYGYIHKCGWMGNVLGSTNMNAHNFLNKDLKLIFLCL